MRAWGFVLLLLASAGCFSTPMPAQPPERLLEYRLAPPDVLRITIRPDPPIEREVTVRPDGRISLDLVGDIVAEGKTVDEIRGEIDAKLRQYIVSPQVTVVLSASNSRRYYVFGEVARSGAYPLVGRVTVVDALASAAGETRFAALNSTRLVRISSERSAVFVVHLEDIRSSGDGTTNYELRPGDVIYVPPSTSARIGYAISAIFFPLQAVLGLAQPVTSVIVPGGGAQ
jgi:polysaccharide export outer membrane protein